MTAQRTATMKMK